MFDCKLYKKFKFNSFLTGPSVLPWQITSIHQNVFSVALVRVWEGSGRHERSLVGLETEISGPNSATLALQLALRRRGQISRHIGSRLHQILRRDHPSIPNLCWAVPGGESRWTITHMWLLSIARGWPCVEVCRMRFAFPLPRHPRTKDWLMKMFNSCPAGGEISRFSFQWFHAEGRLVASIAVNKADNAWQNVALISGSVAGVLQAARSVARNSKSWRSGERLRVAFK